MKDLLLRDPDGWFHRLGDITDSVDYTVCGQEFGEGWAAVTAISWDDEADRCVLGCFP